MNETKRKISLQNSKFSPDNKILCESCYHYRIPKGDVIKFLFSAFQLFHDHIAVEHDEKPLHTKFYMNRFMEAWDMTTWIPN